MVGVAHDVTDRKAAEFQMREAQKMESVGRLAAGLAHDFNNVLTIINGIAELALGDLDEDSPLREHLTGIQAASGRAVQLTRQLLAFSRKQVLHPTVVHLNEIVREAQTLLQRLLGDDVRVEVALMADLPAVRIDAGQFHQVILNLAVNSRDAMPHGGTFRIETRPAERGRRRSDRAHPTLPRGRYAVTGDLRHGHRHGRVDAAAAVRAVLHDQGTGQRHRPGPRHRSRHRQAERRRDRGQHGARPRNDVYYHYSGDRRRGRRAGRDAARGVGRL